MNQPAAENTIIMPFHIGETYWEPFRSPHQVTIPCPVCRGEKIVTMVLGGGEQVSVECEACKLGYEGSSGTITEWTSEPGARAFVIESVMRFESGEWVVRSTREARACFSSLCRTEAEALVVSTTDCAKQAEENMRRQQNNRGRVGRATWSVQYHRNMIKDLERQLAWHRAKIAAKKETP